MKALQFKNIREVLYCTGNLDKALHFYSEYGGWNTVGNYKTDQSVLDFWNLSNQIESTEILLQSNYHSTGQLRLIKYSGVEQDYIRSSQQPWDTGGIMDINLRVHEVANTFEELRELGWHGLSDPLLQVMGPFKLYDILMKGYDDTIIAFTHRVEPPMELTSSIKLPTHIYNSSLTVKNLETSRHFYVEQLGCQLLNEYEVRKDSPQENMFGLPFNLADKVTCKANIFSFDGARDVVFQTVEFQGVLGNDFSEKAIPPNRGFLLYRVEVEGIHTYYQSMLEKQTPIIKSIQRVKIEPYGACEAFAVKSPDGVWWTFFEVIQ